MELVKDKILCSNKKDQVKYLTLVLESWTIDKTMGYFGVSKRSVSNARQLKKEKKEYLQSLIGK